jgi:hypothetical protein
LAFEDYLESLCPKAIGIAITTEIIETVLVRESRILEYVLHVLTFWKVIAVDQTETFMRK